MDDVSYKHRDLFVPLACSPSIRKLFFRLELCKKMREVWYLESENPGSTSGFNIFLSMSLALIVSLADHS